MHSDRIGCRLHNLLPLPAASHSSTSARLSFAGSLSLLLSLSLPLFPVSSAFSVRLPFFHPVVPSIRENDRVSLCEAGGKFRCALRSRALDLCPIDRSGSTTTDRSPRARPRGKLDHRSAARRIDDRPRTGDRLNRDFLPGRGIGFPQIDCVYASPATTSSDLGDTQGIRTGARRSSRREQMTRHDRPEFSHVADLNKFSPGRKNCRFLPLTYRNCEIVSRRRGIKIFGFEKFIRVLRSRKYFSSRRGGGGPRRKRENLAPVK